MIKKSKNRIANCFRLTLADREIINHVSIIISWPGYHQSISHHPEIEIRSRNRGNQILKSETKKKIKKNHHHSMEIIIIQSCHIAYHYHSDPDPEVEAWNVLEPSRRRFRKN